MQAFEYVAAKSISEAIDLLSERGYTLELEGRILDKIWDDA